jgi:putative phosphoribosyl transferase
MSDRPPFPDRRAAGRALGPRLAALRLEAPVVLALPRGGVPVAVEIAALLHAPVDLIFVRKIGAPWQPELAVAAVVDGGGAQIVINEDIARLERIGRTDIEEGAKAALAEIERRRGVYMSGRARLPLEGRTLVLVDDGIATGASVRAAIGSLKRQKPARLVLAVPVASPETLAELEPDVDDIVCLAAPTSFHSVGEHYADFRQVSDRGVTRLLREADAAYSAAAGARGKTGARS